MLSRGGALLRASAGSGLQVAARRQAVRSMGIAYKTPERDVKFVLDELLDVDAHYEKHGFTDCGADLRDGILSEIAKVPPRAPPPAMCQPRGWMAACPATHLLGGPLTRCFCHPSPPCRLARGPLPLPRSGPARSSARTRCCRSTSLATPWA